MAPGLTIAGERRDTTRVRPEDSPWRRLALLRPGQEVEVLNLGPGGALVESLGRLNPGTRAELQLTGPSRHMVRGRIARCRVTALEPLRYEGAIVFDARLEWRG